MQVVFMGTPDFAVPALSCLHQSDHNLILVVTQPDRPKGRGRKLTPPPVKIAAEKMGYEIYQPGAVFDVKLEEKISNLRPDLVVVVAFGFILTRRLLEIPRFGAVNIHASLLPKYRGPAPIQWAIINGEDTTGVTAIQMDEKMDTGDILLAEETEIASDETSATLHDRLSELGGDLLIRVMNQIADGSTASMPQDHARATYCTLLKKQDGHINWSLPAERIEAVIRGVTPWPGAYTVYGDKRLKIFKAKVESITVEEPPGTVTRSFFGEMRVATGKGVLSIQEVQSGSGKRLFIKEFVLGNQIPVGTVLQ
jgi:methionyl-tRNA formyltransferase